MGPRGSGALSRPLGSSTFAGSARTDLASVPSPRRRSAGVVRPQLENKWSEPTLPLALRLPRTRLPPPAMSSSPGSGPLLAPTSAPAPWVVYVHAASKGSPIRAGTWDLRPDRRSRGADELTRTSRIGQTLLSWTPTRRTLPLRASPRLGSTRGTPSATTRSACTARRRTSNPPTATASGPPSTPATPTGPQLLPPSPRAPSTACPPCTARRRAAAPPSAATH